MDDQKLAEFLFPNIQLTKEEVEAKYPKRNLAPGAKVTRFAPSPTGFIHLGSLYTSFVSQIFAKQSGGVFYLRIEDTDGKRQIENGVAMMIRDLKDYEILFDEGEMIGGSYGPYTQSKRKEIYQVFTKYLVSIGRAYPCFMTPEELTKMRESQQSKGERIGCYGSYAIYRDLSYDEVVEKVKSGTPYVIRLKAIGDFSKTIEWKDAIKGNIHFPENDMDVVIMKQDGLPTYHFAHVIDDYLMGTTHVIRGEEWLSSLPIHIHLFQAFHFKIPKYAHLSPLMIRDGDRTRKLSKRHDPFFAIHYYKEAGIPAGALKLYFATLINSNFEQYYMRDKNAHIMDYPFRLSAMSAGGTLFDMDKLMSLSRIYFSRLKAKDLYEDMLIFYKEYDPSFYELLVKYKEKSIAALNIERETKRPRKDLATYRDMKKEMYYFYDELFETPKKELLDPQVLVPEFLKAYIEEYYDSRDDYDTWYDKVKECAYRFGFSKTVKEYKENPHQYIGHIGDACSLLRVALTGRLETPDLYEILKILDRECMEKRIMRFIEE